MSKRTEQQKITRHRLYTNILTDPYFYPATKVLLMYLLEVIGIYYLEKTIELETIDDKKLAEIKEELHLSDCHWKRAIKQLKELDVVKEEEKENVA